MGVRICPPVATGLHYLHCRMREHCPTEWLNCATNCRCPFGLLVRICRPLASGAFQGAEAPRLAETLSGTTYLR